MSEHGIPTRAEVIAAHMPSDIQYCDQHGEHEWHCMAGDGHTVNRQVYAEHVSAAWREARTITSVEVLDALPNGAVYVSDAYPDVPETKARGVWWTAGHDPFEPELPGRVLYLPGEDD